ncbi:aminopeptidase NAALADL1 isoform X1 [Octopus sinensis]|uniref:Aminopeptidase NAALADL1 isoform X1 n=1 Tax=Octopus sinensis TaxID=2607531 RepID=A0A7E6EJ18_9MOLL|nr:aminopeptidase NAALADL1 isoform X1 [Octopus sinensis]
MATDRLSSLDLATVNFDEDIYCKRTSTESNKHLSEPWSAVSATTMGHTEDDNEVQQLLAHSSSSSIPLCYKGPYNWISSCSGAHDKNCNGTSNSSLLSANYSPLPLSTNVFRTTRSRHGSCGSNSTLVLIGLAILIIFLMGLLIGYYVRVGSHSTENERQPLLGSSEDYLDTTENKKICLQKCHLDSKLSDLCSNRHLESIHGNIMYYINGNRMMDLIRDFPKQLPQQPRKDYDNQFRDYIQKKFYQVGLDKVEVLTYNVLVTTPDVKEPNYMEIVNGKGQVQLSAQLKTLNSDSSSIPKISSKTKANHVEQDEHSYMFETSSDNFKGLLYYANYGRSVDFTYLNKLKVTLNDQIAIIRTGKIPISKKIYNAQMAGLRGVLLYTDPESNTEARWLAENYPKSDSYTISYISSDEFNFSDLNESGNKSLLVYNISAALALRIFTTLADTTAAPISWWGSLNTTYNIGISHSVEGHNTLYLKFNSCLKSHTVSNVEGTLYGKTKPDEMVLVGTQRLYGTAESETSLTLNSSVSSLFQMASLSSTAMLLELIYSLLHVRKLEGWHPQRTIKFYSWGTVTGSDEVGIQEYLKRNSFILNSRGVGYVDLMDKAGKWCNHFTAHTDNMATALILKAMNMVPDPDERELSILATTFYQKPNLPLPLTSNGILVPLSDTHTEIMSKWLPSIQFTCKYAPETAKKPKEIKTEPDSSHHFRYHTAVARVSSLVLLSLSDGPGNAYSLLDLVTAVEQQVGSLVEKCRTFHTLSFNALSDAMSKMLSLVGTINHPASIKHSNIPPKSNKFNKKSSHGQWLKKDCQQESLVLHKILAPLTRLNDTSTTLESLLSLAPSLKTGSTAIHCTQPVLEAITTRLYQAWNTLTN